MKRAILLTALLLAAAGYVLLQTGSPSPDLATFLPSGALLYLRAPDLGRLLRDWDSSKVKADWLASQNYDVFSRSNLFSKLGDVYDQYGEAAGFTPDLKSLTEIAGSDSALALYDAREVEFLYISRIADADLMKSQLWAVRAKFQQRQAGGVSFYQRSDDAGKRTVAFTFTKGYLLLATRPDLLAQSLEIMAAGSHPAIASDRWYRDSVAAAQAPGDLRLVMNLETLVKSVSFRSYWVQRNASALRRFSAGIADVRRSSADITEDRVLLHAPETADPARAAAVSSLLALVPGDAGLYKTWSFDDSSAAAALIVHKLIGPPPERAVDDRYAPPPASPDNTAGSEGDLETRIDEQPLPADAGIADSIAAARTLVDQGNAHSLLLVQSTSPAAGTFVPIASVIVLAGDAGWNRDTVRQSLTAAAGKLWTTSQLGAAWAGDTVAQQPVDRLDGLGTVLFAIRGRFLFLSGDAPLLASVLARSGAAPPSAGDFTYAAGFRHQRERANYERIMAALDFTAPAGTPEFEPNLSPGGPSFFSGNLGSLSRVLGRIAEVRLTERETPAGTIQKVVYQLGQ